MKDIPLKVLIIDPNKSSLNILFRGLESMSEIILSVKCAKSLKEAENVLKDSDINTIYIDPLSVGLEKASQFIFDIRERIPGIVFVLYLDFDRMERKRTEFFKGERRRFGHYFKLDKRTPTETFQDELEATIRKCQFDLSYILSNEKIRSLKQELASIQAGSTDNNVNVSVEILKSIQAQLVTLKAAQEERISVPDPKTVFLSYRFEEEDYMKGIRLLLEQAGFTIMTGSYGNTYISQAILERIKLCEFFVSLMTKSEEKVNGKFTTSPWLLEEKGAALALGKRIVLLVEEGVDDIGGLQGDWQILYFKPTNFTVTAFQAVAQLKSYSG
jgi:hypothetical protein